ncbi:sensor histidine kinase [Sporosarcina sp. P21c]|uniref:sensor histidine kinase n=1 Tax=Sporosarcina TaxID=1569 RepID=UPI000A147717|nr:MULTISPECIES: sensor histidine kinase [Sporosarcina]ARJ38596.1 histidine kinase [Sporosarcina ureae]PIC67422.1 sensor histidine kinase [Sporosarcina sp. P16a]PIC89678.1 sensor histidine kinase [Sporosarcina sp. P21c]PIC92873.1 sensor histidine kinase [Sporosarcina sp. P25]
MIRLYLKERASWILFFIFSQLLVLAMGYLDTSIPLLSTVYIAFISCLSFVIFIVMRYEKESRFYKRLETLEPSFDLTAIPEANSPFEAIVSNRMSEQIQEFKHQLDQLQISVEQEKDDMLNWIHEVKTPLTTLQLMIDRTDPVLRSQLMYEWLRIHLLLDQQLHLKRIPFIQNDLYIEKTDVRKLLFQEIKSLRQWCMQKRVGFDVSLETEEVLTDAKWLGFIIRQLLANAVKYSENADISIQSTSKDGITTLTIEDVGQGIASRDLSRIFDKGFTGTANHQNHAATGMGLYLAKQVAESLLITIVVESTVGEGTRFSLIFAMENELIRIARM